MTDADKKRLLKTQELVLKQAEKIEEIEKRISVLEDRRVK